MKTFEGRPQDIISEIEGDLRQWALMRKSREEAKKKEDLSLRAGIAGGCLLPVAFVGLSIARIDTGLSWSVVLVAGVLVFMVGLIRSFVFASRRSKIVNIANKPQFYESYIVLFSALGKMIERGSEIRFSVIPTYSGGRSETDEENPKMELHTYQILKGTFRLASGARCTLRYSRKGRLLHYTEIEKTNERGESREYRRQKWVDFEDFYELEIPASQNLKAPSNGIAVKPIDGKVVLSASGASKSEDIDIGPALALVEAVAGL